MLVSDRLLESGRMTEGKGQSTQVDLQSSLEKVLVLVLMQEQVPA